MSELRRGGDLRPVLLICTIAAAAYTAYALLRHLHYWSGLDLGIFNQAIWHLSNFEAPLSTVKGGANLLSDHFHPILVTLAPLYWIADEPALLLGAQGVLVAASIVPVFLFARERLERLPAYAMAIAYAIFWGVWSGVGFEFHEVAFAPLLVALGVLWGDRRQWGRFAAAMVALCLVKEDMAFVVAFFGLWLLTRRNWGPGVATALGGVAAYLLITKVAMPHFGGEFQYWTYDRIGEDLPDAIARVVTHPWLPFEVAVDDGQKIKTMGGMVVPFLALSLCSRLGLIAVPLVAERMLSSNESLWVAASTHYTLPLAPILAMAAAAGLANVAGLLPSNIRRRAVTVAAVAMLVLGAAFNHLAAKTPSRIDTYASQRSFAAPAARALERVPDEASVATQEFLYPRVTARDTADLIRSDMARVDYIVAGLFERLGTGPANASSSQVGDALRSQLPAFDPVFYDRGWVVLRRRTMGRAPPDALERFPDRQGTRVRAAALAWVRTSTAYGGELDGCRDRTPACFGQAGTGFREHHASLVESLRRAGEVTGGACAEMATAARLGSEEVASLLEAARRAGAGGSQGKTNWALVTARTAVQDRDLVGRVLTVAGLCAPPG
ncbi:MAG: DUF2079 domain-containing protein [Thermoleophilaceae bacterium]